jgi:hypothetical protein
MQRFAHESIAEKSHGRFAAASAKLLLESIISAKAQSAMPETLGITWFAAMLLTH